MCSGRLSTVLVSGGVEIQKGGGLVITMQAVKPCYLWINFHLALTLLHVKDSLSVKSHQLFLRTQYMYIFKMTRKLQDAI